jgi:hypothetical protein
MRRLFGVFGILAFVGAVVTGAQGYSGGPVRNVTDLSTTCAGCHSSMQKGQLRAEPEAFAAGQVAENKHYKAIEAGTGPYQQMDGRERKLLLDDVKAMDGVASVTLKAPAAAKPGQEIEVTVTVKGGHGAVAVMLLDTDLRYQSRSVAGDGWLITGAPKVWGSDGKEQTRWTDSRAQGLKKNINVAVIFDLKADVAAKKFPEGKVNWKARAPREPGNYTMTAALLYGTEKASPAGRVEQVGGVAPAGGPGGPSGRVLFSRVHAIAVRP